MSIVNPTTEETIEVGMNNATFRENNITFALAGLHPNTSYDVTLTAGNVRGIARSYFTLSKCL